MSPCSFQDLSRTRSVWTFPKKFAPKFCCQEKSRDQPHVCIVRELPEINTRVQVKKTFVKKKELLGFEVQEVGGGGVFVLETWDPRRQDPTKKNLNRGRSSKQCVNVIPSPCRRYSTFPKFRIKILITKDKIFLPS